MTQLHITGLSHDGCGVGRTAEGKVVFVPGALPDETITATLGDSRKGIVQGTLEAALPFGRSLRRLRPASGRCSAAGRH